MNTLKPLTQIYISLILSFKSALINRIAFRKERIYLNYQTKSNIYILKILIIVKDAIYLHTLHIGGFKKCRDGRKERLDVVLTHYYFDEQSLPVSE